MERGILMVKGKPKPVPKPAPEKEQFKKGD